MMINDQDLSVTIQNMRNRTTKLEREGDYWHKAEIEQLTRMFYAGVGISEMAVRLQRTEMGVTQQIERLDLYARKLNPQRRQNPCKGTQCLCSTCQLDRRFCPRCKAQDATQEDV